MKGLRHRLSAEVSAGLLASALALGLAAPALADQTMPASAVTQGGGVGTSEEYQLFFTIGQASPVGLANEGGYHLSAGLLPMIADIEPPAIIHQPDPMVAARTEVEVQAEVTDTRTGVDTVVIYFREGGALGFRERPMAKGEGLVYGASLPPSSITERGLAYYIEARDRFGNRSRVPEGAPDSLINLPVYFANLSAAFEVPAGKYRMISVPGTPTDGGPDSVLADDFGAYNTTRWRLGRWNGARTGCGEDCYDEHPAAGDFSPGTAFWLTTSITRSFDASGISADLTRPVDVHVARGWNQIATPFGFPTDWLAAQIVSDGETYTIGELHAIGADTIYVEDNLIAYNGAYEPFQSQLQPWSGYWIYNAGNVDVDLRFDPQLDGQVQDLSPPRLASTAGPKPSILTFTVRVRSDQSPERMALAGVAPTAADAWDPWDLHEPPSIGNALRCVFDQTAWGKRSGLYMSDFRRGTSEGAFWEVSVEGSGRQQASLDLDVTGDLPGTWRVYVYDLEAGVRLDLSTLPYCFEAGGRRDFALVAGTADFVASREASGTIRLKPGIISVVPNPFRDDVRITYYIPGHAASTLKVFSVEGRLVREVTSPATAPGIRTIAWDGKSLGGEPAAPGLYFLRLEAEGTSLVEKVLLVR